MKKGYLQSKADELWYWFEDNLFKNDGIYSYNTNLVFAFADYVDGVSDDDLADFLQCRQKRTVKRFRKMLNNGIDAWLQDFAKTMAIM